MPILATISQNPHLFTPFPSNPPRIHKDNAQKNPPPPIPIPKYPPKKSSQKLIIPTSTPNPAFKIVHHRSKYYKPIPPDGIIAKDDDSDRSVVLGESGVSYRLPGAPFEFQFSYSETPKAKPLAIREPAFLPFAPPTMSRPWTGKAPLKKKKRKVPLLEPFNPATPSGEEKKLLQMPRALNLGRYPKNPKTREQILGEPLSRAEVKKLVERLVSSNRQVNLGRDGLTHNMLELVHCHWRRQPVCKVRCRGVPTVDMNNVCFHLEERTGGKIIHRVGGIVYLFRGRNYNHRNRPVYPIMLWKPAAPVYPKLIQDTPEGLTKLEANELRRKGQDLLPICKLAKNGIYINLVKDVRYAFEGSPLVKIDCRGLEPSDYKKIGAKLKELVPCVLLSFDQEQILMWRGNDWKSIFQGDLFPALDVRPSSSNISSGSVASDHDADDGSTTKMAISSPRMTSLWNRAIESNKALLLDEVNLAPDALLEKVEDFEGISQAAEHSYPALILPSGDDTSNSENNDDIDNNEEDNDDDIPTESLEELDSSIPVGSLPVDLLAKRLMLE